MTAWTGTWTILKLALRRDRIVAPAWIATFAFVVLFSALSVDALYPDPATLVTAGEVINSTPAMVAMYGPIYDVTSLGAVSLVKLTGMGTAMASLLAGMLVVRHTRADEEVGRHELTASGVLGRYATVTASLLLASGVAVLIGLFSALGLIASGLPASGAFAFGASWAFAGIAFAAVAAVAAQVASTARAARGITAIVLIVAYVLRAVADVSAHDRFQWLTWLSPIGWAQQVRPFAGDRWWALLPLLVFAVAVTGLAFFVLTRRDLGAGILPDRDGDPVASPQLVRPFGLAWRLSRAALLGWSIGFAVVGLLLGAIVPSIGDMIDSPQFTDLISKLGGTTVLNDAFLSTELGMASVIATAFGISTVLRLQGEETTGRAEPILVSGVNRVSWVTAQLAVAVIGVTTLLVVQGIAVGAAYAAAIGDPDQLGRTLVASVARAPAAWVMTALAVALYGLRARWAPVAWAALVGVFLVWELGPVMNLPDWTRQIAPYAHIPNLPGATFEWLPLAVLTLLAGALTLVGLQLFSNRDIQPD